MTTFIIEKVTCARQSSKQNFKIYILYNIFKVYIILLLYLY